MTIALLPDQLDRIIAACRRYHVARMHAFGSVLSADFRPGVSDIDLLVEFQPTDASQLYRSYFGLLNELRQSLSTEFDLVMAHGRYCLSFRGFQAALKPGRCPPAPALCRLCQA
jgi:predicted nucleotidyltransferase